MIKPGDLVNIDVSAELDGYYADTGGSFHIPPIDPRKQHLLDTTRKALEAAIQKAKGGAWKWAPKVTLFNGQTAKVNLPAKEPAGISVDLNPVISADRRFIRLGIATQPAKAEKPSNAQSLLKDGHTLLLQAGDSNSKVIITVTPRIIVQEEEEELLGIPEK